MLVLTVSNISHTVSFLTVSKLTFTLPISVDFDSVKFNTSSLNDYMSKFTYPVSTLPKSSVNFLPIVFISNVCHGKVF